MAKELRFLLDGEDRGQPLNPEEFGVKVNEDTNLNARLISFDNDLVFGGLTYQYLFDLFVDGTCNLVTVNVQYKCASGWEYLVDGWFILSECVFNLDRCQVTTKLYDETFSTKINNNKGIPFSTASAKTKNLIDITPPQPKEIEMFNPPTGIYGTENPKGITIFQAFQHLVTCMSDGLIDFGSDFYTVQSAPSETPMLTNGRAIFNRDSTETIITFEQLFSALSKKTRLGLGFEKQPNGRPLLRIEPAEYFFQSNESANLLNQPNIKMSVDTTSLYATVGFGNAPYLEKFECNGGETACTFLQVPFRGFRDEVFGMLGTCNTSTELDLQSNDVVFDTNVIEDIYRFNSQQYMNNPVVIYCNVIATVGDDRFQAKQGDPLSLGQTVYNAEYTNEQVSANWLGGYPNSLVDYIAGFNPLDTDFNYKMDASPTQSWEYDDEEPTSYSEWTGDYIVFGTAVNPNSNFVNGRTYVVPYAGVYSFTFSAVLDDIFETGSRDITPVLRIFNAADELYLSIEGSVFTANNIEVIYAFMSATVALNQGDRVRCDLIGQQNTSGGLVNQVILHELNIDGVDRFTQFTGIGVPFEPSILQPVDPESIRNVLYTFERPLSMVEINSILNNTSSPIKLGRTTDTNAAINGYIKTLEIQSFTRQNANFVLKSNQILR
jgi:hypothetical protein